MVPSTDVSKIIKKYSDKLSSSLDSPKYSSDYKTFKAEMVPKLSNYEKWTKSLGNVLSIKIAENDRKKIQKFLDIAHLEATASQALTLSIVSLFTILLLSLLVCVSVYLINPSIDLSNLVLLGFLGLKAGLDQIYEYAIGACLPSLGQSAHTPGNTGGD